jgi:hypothetical protein
VKTIIDDVEKSLVMFNFVASARSVGNDFGAWFCDTP